jgi:hypothetical protein
MELDRCQGCNEPIRWVVTVYGKHMPLNPDPTPDGNVVYTHENEEGPVKVLTKAEVMGPATRYRYKAHFATCVEARRRARGATQERFDEETLELERPAGTDVPE